METDVLSDRLVKPNDEIVFLFIGDKQLFWKQITNYLYTNYSDISEEWKFYNDGKSWLFRTLKKKETIFWIKVLENTFRIGFWFGDKAAPVIEQSDLPVSIKEDFMKAKKYGAIRSISIEMKTSAEVDIVLKLVDIKLKLK